MVSAEAPVPGLQLAALSLCPHVAFPLCLPIPGIPSSSYKDTSQAELELTRMTSFDLNDFLKGPMSKYNHIGCSGLRSLWSALPEHESHHLWCLHRWLPPACSPISPLIHQCYRHCASAMSVAVHVAAWSLHTYASHDNWHASLRQEPAMRGQSGLTLGKSYLN